MAWWNGNWKYRQEVKITNNTGKYLYGYPVMVTLTNSTFDFQHANTYGKDIRCISSDNATSYLYWIEQWNWGEEAKIWVRIPTIAPGTETTFFLYYGNPDAAPGASDPELIFSFYEGFESGNVDDWTQTNTSKGELIAQSDVVEGGDYAGLWYWKQKGTAYSYLSIPELRDEDVVIEFVRRDGGYSGQKYTILGLDETAEDAGNGIKLYFNHSEHKFEYYDGSMHTIMEDVDPSTWYKFKIKVYSDGDDSKFDLWINNEKKITGGGTRGSVDSVTLLQFQMSTSSSGWAKEYIDEILVRKYAEPDPTTELGRVDSLIIDRQLSFPFECEGSYTGKYTYLISEDVSIPSALSFSFLPSFCSVTEQSLWFYVLSYLVHRPPFPYPCANPVYVSNDSEETFHDVAVFIDLTSPPFDYSQCGSDGWNLKFVTPDYSQDLPFWIEEWNYGGVSRVWVKLPEIPPGKNVCAYLVYGFHDTSEVRPQEPEEVFYFFDGFEDGDISDWNKRYEPNWCTISPWSISLDTDSKHGDYSVKFSATSRPSGCPEWSMIFSKTVTLPPGKKVLRFWHKDNKATCPTSHFVKVNDQTVFEMTEGLSSTWINSSTEPFEDSGDVKIEIGVWKGCTWEEFEAYIDSVHIEKAVDATFFAFLGDKLPQLPLFHILTESPVVRGALRTNDTWIEGHIFDFPHSLQEKFRTHIQTETLFNQEIVACPGWNDPLKFPYTWTRRRAVIINNETGEDIEDCQVYLELTPSNFDYTHCNKDGSDIRFIDAKFSKTLPYFIQKWEYNGTSKIWVRVDKIPKGSHICMYMYYDNPCTGISKSDASQVFKRILPVRFWYPFEDVYESENGPIETKEAWGRLNLRLSGEENVEDIVIDTPWGKGIHVPPDRYWTNPFHDLSYSQHYAMAIKFKRDEDNPCQDGEFVGIDSGWDVGWRFGIRDGKIFHVINNLPYPPESDEWTDIDTLDTFDWEDLIISDNGKYRAYFRNGELRATHKNTVVNKKDARHAYLYIGINERYGSTLYGSYDEVVIFARELLSDEVKDYHECRGEYFPEYVGQMFLRKNVHPLPTCSLGNEELATPLWDIVIQHSEDIKFNTTHLLGEILNVLPEIPSSFTTYSQLPTLDEEAKFLIYDMVTGIINRDNATIEFGDVFIQKKLWIFALLEEYPQLVTTFFSSFKEVFSVSSKISISKPVHWTIRGTEVPDLISYKVTQEWAAPDTAELRFRGVPQFLMGDYVRIVYETGNPSYPEVTLFKGPVLTIDRELVKGREETVVRAVSNEWYLTKQNCFWGDESVLYGLDPGFTTRSLLSMWLGDWRRCGSGYGCLCTWVTIPGIFEGICKKLREKCGWKEEKRWDPPYASLEEWWNRFNGRYVGHYWDKTTGVAPYYFENVPEWQTKYVENAGKSGFNFFYGTSKWDGIMQICNVCDCVFYCIYSDSNVHISDWEDTNYPPYTGGDGKRLAIFLTRDSCENQTLIYRPSDHPPRHSFQSGFESSEFFNPLAREFALKIDDDPDHGEYIKKLIGIREREEQSSEETKINRLAVTCQDFPIVTAEVDTGGKPVEEYIAINNVDINDLADLETFAKERLQELRTPNVTFEARFLDLVFYKFQFNWEDAYIPIHTGMYIGLEGIEGLPPSSDEDGYYRIMKITYEMGEQTGGKLLTTLECRDTDLIHPGSPKLNEIENIMHREARKIEKGPILPGHPCPSNPRPPMLGEIPWMEIGEIIDYHPGNNTVDIKITKTGQIIKGVPLL